MAAEHFKADSIIHFGHACLSPTNRLPVLYIFGHKEIDVPDCVEKFNSLYSAEDNVVLIYETEYDYVAGNPLTSNLHQYHISRIFSDLILALLLRVLRSLKLNIADNLFCIAGNSYLSWNYKVARIAIANYIYPFL